MYMRILKKDPEVKECYGWRNLMAFDKSKTYNFSEHEKAGFPGKPNSVL